MFFCTLLQPNEKVLKLKTTRGTHGSREVFTQRRSEVEDLICQYSDVHQLANMDLIIEGIEAAKATASIVYSVQLRHKQWLSMYNSRRQSKRSLQL